LVWSLPLERCTLKELNRITLTGTSRVRRSQPPRRDAPDAVLMSLDTFNRWMETVHLLKTPANATHLEKSIQRLRKGKTKARPLVDT